jgi:hypothetical protein
MSMRQSKPSKDPYSPIFSPEKTTDRSSSDAPGHYKHTYSQISGTTSTTGALVKWGLGPPTELLSRVTRCDASAGWSSSDSIDKQIRTTIALVKVRLRHREPRR